MAHAGDMGAGGPGGGVLRRPGDLVIRRRIVTSSEQDVHSRWRKLYTRYYRAGVCKDVKRSTNQRERREGRTDIRQQMDEM